MSKKRFLAVPAAMMIALGTVGVGFQGVAQAAAPNAPTAVTVVAGNAQVALTWIAAMLPETNPPSPAVTSYTATASPGGQTCTATAPAVTCTVTGLTNGTTYTFTVRATNADGTSLPSDPSPPATPFTAPVPPVLNSITNGNGDVYVEWSAPTNNGGAPIASYQVFTNPAGVGIPVNPACTVTPRPPATLPVTNCVTTSAGLTNDTVVYSVWVTATNTLGAQSAPSNVLVARPSATAGVPAAPTSVTAVNNGPTDGLNPNVGTATIAWTPPAAIAGYPVTSYTATSTPGNLTCTSNTIVAPATSPVPTCQMAALVNGTAYTFTVTATNANGTSVASTASNSITPYSANAAPAAPATVLAVAGPSQATLTWAQSASPTPVLAYEVSIATGPAGTAGTVVCSTTSALTCVVSGLTPNTPYTFSVRARNSVGWGPAALSAAVTPLTSNTPSAPQTVAAVAGAGQATITWTAPALDGGSAITSYTVTGTPGGTCTTTGLSCTITGLTPGTSYTFTVRASNANGAGAVSAASNAVVPTGQVPGAPTGVTATAGNAQATVSWTAPASNGGSAITGYTVTSAASILGNPVRTCTTAGATSCTVTGLTNGVTYTFSVTATNAVGTGASSASSNAVTPGLVPGAPTAVTATAGDAKATVSWTAPTNTGGAAITGYTVTSSPGSRTCTTTGATSCEVTGLTNDVTYTFTVVARNAIGTGPASAASNAVTPRGTNKTITIAGARGTGSEANMIFVDGITENLVGKTVTPYFRFPGQSGFTAGTGTRTVDANGDFAWQRKTGKRIVVEFRGDGITSNRVVIQAK